MRNNTDSASEINHWHKGQQRPLLVAVKWALKHFEPIWAADGSILSALFRKLDSLQDLQNERTYSQ